MLRSLTTDLPARRKGTPSYHRSSGGEKRRERVRHHTTDSLEERSAEKGYAIIHRSSEGQRRRERVRHHTTDRLEERSAEKGYAIIPPIVWRTEAQRKGTPSYTDRLKERSEEKGYAIIPPIVWRREAKRKAAAGDLTSNDIGPLSLRPNMGSVSKTTFVRDRVERIRGLPTAESLS